MSVASPEELIARAAAGDVAAFARIVRLHHAEMTQVALVVTGDLDMAAEAVSTAWPVAWIGLRDTRSPEGLGQWLCTLAAAEAVTLARSSDPPAERDDPAVPVDRGLLRAIARLEPADRALLAIRHVAGLSLDDLARVRPRSTPPVGVRLEQLALAIGCAPSPGSGRGPLHRIEVAMLDFARVPVRPVDADAVARGARAAERMERQRLISVAISLVGAAVIAGWPYLALLLRGR